MIRFADGDTVVGPVGLFATFLHEQLHAFAGVLCGASVESLDVESDGSGVTVLTGASGDTTRLVVSSAGYVGVMLWAAAFIVVGRSPRASRTMFIVTGVLCLLTSLLWANGAFPFGVGVVVGGANLVLGVLLTDRWVTFAATVAGAVLGFTGLLSLAGAGDRNVDALHASAATGVSLGVVRFVWLLVALVVVGAAIASRRALGRRAAPSAPGAVEPE